MDEAERDALFCSLSLTLGRAHYHHARFDQVVAALDQRRGETGAVVTYDTFAQYTLYEASAVLGAVRSGVDELLFIAARLAGCESRDAHDRWKANDVVTSSFDKRPEFNIPEVHALRTRRAWYDELNDYRNVIHHRGWRTQIGGYFPLGSELPESRDASQNIMLVPDRSSLVNRSRPHEWRYNQIERLEHVVERAVSGFSSLIDDVCMNCWGGTVPEQGTVPRSQHANVIVVLAKPVVLSLGQDVIVPIFTTVEAARAFRFPRQAEGLDLIETSSSSLIVGEPAFAFGLPGLRSVVGTGWESGDLVLLIDPTAFDSVLRKVPARHEERIPLRDVLALDDTTPFSLRRDALGVDRVFLWRKLPAQTRNAPDSAVTG